MRKERLWRLRVEEPLAEKAQQEADRRQISLSKMIRIAVAYFFDHGVESGPQNADSEL